MHTCVCVCVSVCVSERERVCVCAAIVLIEFWNISRISKRFLAILYHLQMATFDKFQFSAISNANVADAGICEADVTLIPLNV